MALSWRARRRLSALILVAGLPLYIVAAVTFAGWLGGRYGRLPVLAELGVYLGLGFLWAVPFRLVFRGIGKADPKEKAEQSGDRSA